MRALALVVAAGLALSGCATTGTSGTLTPAQSLYGAETAYSAALTLAVAYRQLPTCGHGVAVCHDPAVVAKLVAADTAARAALAAAQAAVTADASNAADLVGVALTLVQSYQTLAVTLNKD